jgi:hypothetical protein
VPVAVGQRLLFHHLFGRGWLAIVLVIVAILLIRCWPLLVARFERRRRR